MNNYDKNFDNFRRNWRNIDLKGPNANEGPHVNSEKNKEIEVIPFHILFCFLLTSTNRKYGVVKCSASKQIKEYIMYNITFDQNISRLCVLTVKSDRDGPPTAVVVPGQT